MLRNLFSPSVPRVAAALLASFAVSLSFGSSAKAQCAPEIVGSVNTPGLTTNVAVSGTRAYVVYASGFHVIDISDPANPTTLGSLNTPGWANSVAVSGATAYVAAGNSGLHVIDVSNPRNPMILGSVITTGDAIGVTVSGTTAYVAADFGGLHVIDVSNPVNPTILGSVAMTGPVTYAWDVSVSGDKAYVTGYSLFDPEGWLHVIDVSDPENPTILGSLKMVRPAYGNDVVGTITYVTVHFNTYTGLQLVDVSDPANPTALGWADTGSTMNGAWSVAVSGPIAYVADGHSGLQAIDVSDPANPTNYGSVILSGFAVGVAVSGNYAYVATQNFGLHVLDLQSCRVPGACCVNGGCAVVLTEADCLAINGTFFGEGSSCDNAECPPKCDADLTGDGVVDGFDLLELLSQWGQCKELRQLPRRSQ